ncbi:MAG: type II CAAX endopeptidase family protein [Maribacter sp.]
MEKENKYIGWVRVIALIVPYFVTVGIFQLLGYLITGVDLYPSDSIKTAGQQAIISFFGFLGTLLIIGIFTRFWDKEKFMNLGFHITNRFKEFLAGLSIGSLVMGTAYAFFLVLGQIRYLDLNFDSTQIILSVIVFILVAVTEEVLIRGYVLKNLMVSFNKYVALIISSVLFSLIHGANPNVDWLGLINLFLAGILLGLSYIHTRNLWFPISLHLSWNLFQSLFGFNVSGQDFYSLVNFEIVENSMLNGGDFGLEGSVFCFLAQLVLITGIAWYYRNESAEKAFLKDTLLVE